MDFYGTIGPACADVKLLQQMVEAGMTGIRMNLSHGPLAAHEDWLALLRKAGVKKLLIDLQGPELRIGRLPQPLTLTAGQTVRLGTQGIPCPAALVQGVQPGQELLLDDGKLLARVDAVESDALVCTVVRGGVLQSRKSLAAPGADIQMPTLTAEDKENLAIAAPDMGGAKRANAYAKELACPVIICHKSRERANVVASITAIGDVEGKNIVIVDDLIDTAGTLVKAAEVLMEKGAASVRACVTHAVLSGPAYDRINNSCLKEVFVTDTIPLKEGADTSKIKVVSMAETFAAIIRKVYNYEPISTEFIF